jgi:hypothetical protein
MIETYEPAGSTNVARATYDSDQRTLVVEFLTGNTYEYRNVPQDVWFGLQHSPSAGGYVYRNIRDRYAFTEV